MNLLQLSSVCHDESSAAKFLQERNILDKSRVCSKGHDMRLEVTSHHARWRCDKSTCRVTIGCRAGTWLQNSRLPLRKVVLFIYCWSRELTSIKFCNNELDMSPPAVVDWNNYLREVCADQLLKHPMAIGGPGCDVELDESLFSRRKNNSGRVLPPQWVFGGFCRNSKDCFLYAVPDRSAATLVPIIASAVRPGSNIYTDEWRSYAAIPKDTYRHLTVNHSLNFVNPDTGAHTQSVESMWRLAKMGNKRRCGTNRELLDSYLCEFMFRQRHKDNDIFDQILVAISEFQA